MQTTSTNSSAVVSNDNNNNVSSLTAVPVRSGKKLEPTGWPDDADKYREAQLKDQNEIDFLELQKTDLRTYVRTLLTMLPIPLRFKGLTLLPGFKFAIVRANTTLTLINFYAQQVGDCPECKTFVLSEFFNHIYCVLTKGMTPGKQSYIAAMQAYETYKNNPVEAISCVFRYQGKDVAIPLSQLVNDRIVEEIRKWVKPLKKEDILQFKENLLSKYIPLETPPIEPQVITGGTVTASSSGSSSAPTDGAKIQPAVDNKKQKRQSASDKQPDSATASRSSSPAGTNKPENSKRSARAQVIKNEESGSDSEVQSEAENESGDSDEAMKNEHQPLTSKSAEPTKPSSEGSGSSASRKKYKTQNEEGSTVSDRKLADREAEPSKRKKKTQTTPGTESLIEKKTSYRSFVFLFCTKDPSSAGQSAGKRKRNSTTAPSSVADDPTGSPKRSSRKSSSAVGSSTPTSAKKSKSSSSSPLSSFSIELKIDQVDPVVTSEIGNLFLLLMSGMFNYPPAATPMILKTLTVASEKARNMPCFAASAKQQQQVAAPMHNTISVDDVE